MHAHPPTPPPHQSRPDPTKQANTPLTHLLGEPHAARAVEEVGDGDQGQEEVGGVLPQHLPHPCVQLRVLPLRPGGRGQPRQLQHRVRRPRGPQHPHVDPLELAAITRRRGAPRDGSDGAGDPLGIVLPPFLPRFSPLLLLLDVRRLPEQGRQQLGELLQLVDALRPLVLAVGVHEAHEGVLPGV